MGRDAASSPPSSLASFSTGGIFSGALIPRPTATMIGAWVKSTACLASRKSSSGLVRTCSGLSSALRRRALERDVGGGFALKHLPDEDQPTAFMAIADAVGDHPLPQRSGELRRIVAHLI